jgi:NAD(P)H-dependent flavin oxidoreductase YrpB (nitropropane dioxygenase family)
VFQPWYGVGLSTGAAGVAAAGTVAVTSEADTRAAVRRPPSKAESRFTLFPLLPWM